jgi:hypothetical protein
VSLFPFFEQVTGPAGQRVTGAAAVAEWVALGGSVSTAV